MALWTFRNDHGDSLEDSEKAPLTDSADEKAPPPPRSAKSWQRPHALSICAHALVAFVYLAMLSLYAARDCRNARIYSPANEALEFENQVFHGELSDMNSLKGPPSLELDMAWYHLLAPTAIRASAHDIRRMNITSIALKDGSGFFVTLDVYHQLHCVNYLHRYTYPEYYNITEPNIREHVDHCLDTIRQYVMCNADVVFNTYAWKPGHKKPWPVFTTAHQCVNWAKLHKWAMDHSFDGFDPALISNPNFA